MLRDPALWLVTLLGAAIGALYGLTFGPSIGETPLVGAVALGLMGAGAGLAVGLCLAWMRSRSRKQAVRLAAALAQRESFVAHLNRNKIDQKLSLSISVDDPRALVLSFNDERLLALDAASRAALEEKTARRIRELVESDDGRLAAELRANDFGRWVVRMNGATVYEKLIEPT